MEKGAELMSPRKKLLRLSLALTVLSFGSLFVLVKVAHHKGKRLYILSSIRKVLPSFDSQPDGYPITVLTRKREKIYFDMVNFEVVNAWKPEEKKPQFFQFETDTGGQLRVSSTLETVRELQVLTLPTFSRRSAKKAEALSEESRRDFDPATLGTDGNFGDNYLNPAFRKNAIKKASEYSPLPCRLRLKFDTGKVLDGNVTCITMSMRIEFGVIRLRACVICLCRKLSILSCQRRKGDNQ